MTPFLQATVYGLLQGGLLALVAVGFSLVWGVMNVVNLAHGALAITGAYFSWQLHESLGLDPVLSLVVVLPVMFMVGYVIQRGLINLVVNAPIWMTLLLTFGLEALIVNGLLLAFTGDFRSTRTGYSTNTLALGGVRIPYARLIAFGLSLLLTVALVLFIRNTKMGLAIRATGMDRTAARLMGMNVRHVYAVTFGTATALAAAAGSMIGLVGTFTPVVDGGYTLQSFVIAVLGGLGNMWGALAGGLVLGLATAWGALYLSGTLVNAIAFGILVLVLIVRPSGLLGKPYYEARAEA